MAEVGLNDPQIDTRFSQMRGIRMTQGMDAGRFRDAARLPGRAKGALHSAFVYGLCGRNDGNACACRCGKEPAGMPMGAPILAQQTERPLGQRHIAILAAFALPHMHPLPRTINVSDLQVHAFPQPQATRINRRQTDAIA